MAQRTAFLNSDAKGFNKDFHHTWINNYMLKQPGVMFSNYTTKPEFALGNGQISGGKAIIRCTRTTGTFAGEEILACFESTSTENISTAGNKKVYIEIPEVYVNDSTAITDSLTQGANLNVGRIVSSDSYPTHSNYIKLWEISNGDWQNATDLRPEVLRRGKPNTISYFGGNGEEERIDIDNASLNKYLMSNGAGVAPSWEEGGGGGGGSGENFKRTFTADEDLLAKSMFGVAKAPTVDDVNATTYIGRYSGQTKNAFCVVLNGESFSSLSLNMSAVNSPADTVTVRIETVDSNGHPTGTLVDVGAYGTVTPTSETGTVTVSLAGEVSGLTAHTKAAVVISRDGSVSSSNYFTLGTSTNKESYHINKMLVYSSTSEQWSMLGSNTGCVDCDGFASEYILQSSTSYAPTWLGYCETGASAGNDFTGILAGTVDYSGATLGTKYYITTDGTLVTFKTAYLVGECIEDGVLRIGVDKAGQTIYDAIVDVNGSGDYTTISQAVSAGKKNIFVKNGTYTMSSGTLSSGDFNMIGESKNGVIINVTYPTRNGTIFTITSDTSTSHSSLISNVTFNITYTGEYGYFLLFEVPDKSFLALNSCNVRVVSAENGCNFYLCDSSGQMGINGCYIEVTTDTGTPQGLGFVGMNNNSTCEDSIIVVDLAQTMGTTGFQFNCTPNGVFIGCKFLVGKTHNTTGDVALLGCSTGIRCTYESSSHANQRIYGYQQNSSFSQTGVSLTYDSDLNTAVTSKKISIWKPSTSYTVGQYVMSGNSTTLARCTTAHTSGTTFDATKFENIYGDTFISGSFYNCSFSVWGTIVVSGIATYYSGASQPAHAGNISHCQFSCYTSSSAQPDYCNIIVLSNRGFDNNKILNSRAATSICLYLGGECSTFIGNMIMSALGYIYAGGYGNLICNNIFTYITGGTAPTITEVTSGQNQIANNVIRGVADWTD